ncbi:hypothetical protein D3C81_1592720 [compost metagenome]
MISPTHDHLRVRHVAVTVLELQKSFGLVIVWIDRIVLHIRHQGVEVAKVVHGCHQVLRRDLLVNGLRARQGEVQDHAHELDHLLRSFKLKNLRGSANRLEPRDFWTEGVRGAAVTLASIGPGNYGFCLGQRQAEGQLVDKAFALNLVHESGVQKRREWLVALDKAEIGFVQLHIGMVSDRAC